jgi:hypothetical protein
VEGSHERCIEVLMKGVETASRGPIVDAYGVERSLARVSWWTGEWSAAATDKPTVFGHYWHLPPVAEHASTVPVHPLNSGAEDAHRKAMAPQVPARGVWHVPPDQRMICVDFQGVYKGAKRPCVGAYRWPEHEVVWASGVTE